MIEDLKKDTANRMNKSLAALEQGLHKVRTGRAHASLLDHLTVPYYGSETPLKQVANVAVADARTLSVTPWEKNMVAAVEKAIRASDLGLNPATSGDTIHVPLPALTEERRRDMSRIVRHESEATRVAIRNIRRDANHDLKEYMKEKLISEDDERHGEEIIQKSTDRAVAKVDEMLEAKEKELMEI